MLQTRTARASGRNSLSLIRVAADHVKGCLRLDLLLLRNL